MFYPRINYKLEGFEPSHLKTKKYNAVLSDKDSGRLVRVPFGDPTYAQFKDSTGLGIYSHLDHGDHARRKAFRKRHTVFLKPGMFSPAYFSLKYLW